MLELAWGARTDVGRHRSRNEDAYLADERVFAVADGMGGHARGDVAAAMAVAGLRPLVGTAFARADLLDAVRQAHDDIGQAAASGAEGEMGTTLCGLAAPDGAEPGSLLVFNVGDSRVYRLRGGDLVQLTHDHSVVQELVDEGRIRPEAASTHPERHVVTRSLGSGDRLEIDWWTTDAEFGDRFLLCSDGLVKELDPLQVAVALGVARPPQDVADDLVARALAAGGRDNVTVVVIDVAGSTGPVVLDLLDQATEPRSVDAPTAPLPGRSPAPAVVATAAAPSFGTQQ